MSEEDQRIQKFARTLIALNASKENEWFVNITLRALDELNLRDMASQSWRDVEMDVLELVSLTFYLLALRVTRISDAAERSPAAAQLALYLARGRRGCQATRETDPLTT